MKEFVDWLTSVFKVAADHPLMYGLLAAIARWSIGNRSGGWWAFFGTIASSCVVAVAAALWLADYSEFPQARKLFFVILLSFAARDILTVILLLGEHAKNNPLDLLDRVITALRKGPKS